MLVYAYQCEIYVDTSLVTIQYSTLHLRNKRRSFVTFSHLEFVVLFLLSTEKKIKTKYIPTVVNVKGKLRIGIKGFSPKGKQSIFTYNFVLSDMLYDEF